MPFQPSMLSTIYHCNCANHHNRSLCTSRAPYIIQNYLHHAQESRSTKANNSFARQFLHNMPWVFAISPFFLFPNSSIWNISFGRKSGSSSRSLCHDASVVLQAQFNAVLEVFVFRERKFQHFSNILGNVLLLFAC